jgi:hypothetical protein
MKNFSSFTSHAEMMAYLRRFSNSQLKKMAEGQKPKADAGDSEAVSNYYGLLMELAARGAIK